MPELLEQMYCSQQIVIPPKFPYILKRYCKAAIKTQPYDLLRWSFEYFRCLSLHRPPPVKLRLEYPVYSTEGGLTRGCLKVLAQQLVGMSEIPTTIVKAAWQGFCLDPRELQRILCLCEVYLRAESVPYLHFVAVAGGLLTKSLTNTMILLCETLTKEPDGGSAAIPVQDFLTMYKFLAEIDASEDVKYLNGYREGLPTEPESIEEEEEMSELIVTPTEVSLDDFWGDDTDDLQKITLTNDHVARTARLSVKLNLPVIGHIQRSPSIERATQIERENYLKERKGKPLSNEEIEQKLQELCTQKPIVPLEQKEKTTKTEATTDEGAQMVHIIVTDVNGEDVPYEIYGEPKEDLETEPTSDLDSNQSPSVGDVVKAEEDTAVSEKTKINTIVNILLQRRRDRRENLQETLDELSEIVDKYHTANYDLGMVAGRQMSTTSGEFIVQHIEKEILAYIDEQIAILPDPDLKKKKAKPDEVEMIRNMVEDFIDDNISIICPDFEEVEEEEAPIPEINLVYAVPGIGPPVDPELVHDFEEYAWDVCKVQADMFMPRNIRHFMCPPLEKYVDDKYDAELSKQQEEEVATGGVITD